MAGEFYVYPDLGEDGTPTAVFLDDDWLTPDEREFKTRALTRQDAIRTTYDPPEADSILSLSTPSVEPTPMIPRVSAPALISDPPEVRI